MWVLTFCNRNGGQRCQIWTVMIRRMFGITHLYNWLLQSCIWPTSHRNVSMEHTLRWSACWLCLCVLVLPPYPGILDSSCLLYLFVKVWDLWLKSPFTTVARSDTDGSITPWVCPPFFHLHNQPPPSLPSSWFSLALYLYLLISSSFDPGAHVFE